MFCFFTLGCVIWANEMFFYKRKNSIKEILLMTALFTIGSFSKAVYIPIILLVTLLPALKTVSKKRRIMIGIGVVVVFSLVMMTFILPTLTSTVARDLSLGGDARGGDTNIVGQLISMLKHPWASVKLMVSNITNLDTFRNLGRVDKDNFFFGNLLFLNFGEMGVLPDKWCILLIPLLLMIGFTRDENRIQYSLKVWDVMVICVSIIATVALIWMALYLSFTPVGDENIAGVQARYYMPLIYLLISLVPNTKICFDIDKSRIPQLIFIGAFILGSVMLYKCVLTGRIL